MSRQGHRFFAIGCVAALLAVALGAMGAHALKGRISPELMVTYQTAVTYHFYHCLGLLALGLASAHCSRPGLLRWAGHLMVCGLVLFSGSLYLLSITGIGLLGAITPFGGLAWMAAWVLAAAAMWPIADAI